MSEDYLVRPYQSGDEEKIVQLLKLGFKGWPHFDLSCAPLDHWRWKYQNYTLKSNLIITAISGNKIIGTIHSVPLRIKIYENFFPAVIGCDVATHPEFRKRGVRNNLEKMLMEMSKNSEVELRYVGASHPIAVNILKNDKSFNSFPIELKQFAKIKDINQLLQFRPQKHAGITKLGFYILKIFNDIRNFIFDSKSVNYKLNILEINFFDDKIDEFCDKLSEYYNFIIERGQDYLNWRYCDSRGGNYLVKIIEENGQILGYIVLRINRYNKDYPLGYVIDLLTLPDRIDVASTLIMDAINYFENEDINVISYLCVKNGFYKNIFKKHGFLDTRKKPHVFYSLLNIEDHVNSIKNTFPSKIHFCYGDLDGI